jgi:hypothetical protein
MREVKPRADVGDRFEDGLRSRALSSSKPDGLKRKSKPAQKPLAGVPHTLGKSKSLAKKTTKKRR